jgi:hypothetical protein
MPSARLKGWGIGLSVACYLLALPLRVINLKTQALPDLPGDYFTGLSCLIHGIWLMFDLRPIWLANPLWLGALVLLYQHRLKMTAFLSLLATGLGLTALELLGQPIALGPGGTGQQIVSLDIGYGFWILALVLPGLIALVQLFKTSCKTSTVIQKDPTS